MQKRRGNLAAHPLAQRELACWRFQDRFEREHGGQHIEIFTVARRLYGIDIPDQLKGIDHRYVPPELRALPEHHTDVAHMLLSLLPGRFPIDAAGAAVWRQNAAHDFNAAAFPRPVGPNVSDHLPILNREAYVAQRFDFFIFSMK